MMCYGQMEERKSSFVMECREGNEMDGWIGIGEKVYDKWILGMEGRKDWGLMDGWISLLLILL